MIDTDTSVRSRVIETRPFAWKTFKFVQHDSFKQHNDAEKERLKRSLLTNGFVAPFYAWEHEGEVYCLDGRHRSLDLESLISEGIDVPELLDTTFLRLDSMEQAAKMVLIFSSVYAKVTNDGLFEFISNYELDFDALKMDIDIPELNLQSFERLLLNENYSDHNFEVTDDDITGDMVLKLKFNKETFIVVNGALNALCKTLGVSTKEEAILKLLIIDEA